MLLTALFCSSWSHVLCFYFYCSICWHFPIIFCHFPQKYRCVPKIGFGFKFGFEKGFRYKDSCFFYLFAGFLDFRLEFLVVIFVCSPVFLWNPTTSRLGKTSATLHGTHFAKRAPRCMGVLRDAKRAPRCMVALFCTILSVNRTKWDSLNMPQTITSIFMCMNFRITRGNWPTWSQPAVHEICPETERQTQQRPMLTQANAKLSFCNLR